MNDYKPQLGSDLIEAMLPPETKVFLGDPQLVEHIEIEAVSVLTEKQERRSDILPLPEREIIHSEIQRVIYCPHLSEGQKILVQLSPAFLVFIAAALVTSDDPEALLPYIRW